MASDNTPLNDPHNYEFDHIPRHRKRTKEMVPDDYVHLDEREEWNQGTLTASHYQEFLEDSKQNPLSQHGPTGSLHKIIKPEEMPWEDSPHGKLKWILNEKMEKDLGPTGAVNTDLYMQIIPPGGKSGKHRHMSEELVFVLDGDGYDLHWDPTAVMRDKVIWKWPKEPQKFLWETNDVIFIPTNTAHQHFNASEDRPVRLLCCNARIYNHLGLGFNDLEQFENAPEYQE